MGQLKKAEHDTLMEDGAEVSRIGGLDMQVCVPTDWTDDAVLSFAEYKNPCGTMGGWQIRKEGSEFLKGAPERNPCEDKRGFVHITLDV